MNINRIYHHWEKWECYKNGFYDIIPNNNKAKYKNIVIDFFNNKDLTTEYMQKVIEQWEYSCEHFLSNKSMNRVAWIGQASLCIYKKVPNLITMHFWNYLEQDIKDRSNKIAQNTIIQWEQKIKSKNILNLGNKKVTKMGFQIMLPLN